MWEDGKISSYNNFGVIILSLKVFKQLALSPFPLRRPGLAGSTFTLKLVVGVCEREGIHVVFGPGHPRFCRHPPGVLGDLGVRNKTV